MTYTEWIRDEGTTGKKGVFTDDSKTKLAVDDWGDPIEAPERPRAAWPDHVRVKIKSVPDGKDIDLVQRLGARVTMTQRGDEAAEMTAEPKSFFAATNVFAVFVKRYDCELGKGDESWFEDPTTCKLDEDGDPIAGTGTRLIPWPDDIDERVKVAANLPSQVLAYVNSVVNERANAPLPGSQPLKSAGKPGSISTMPTKSSSKA